MSDSDNRNESLENLGNHGPEDSVSTLVASVDAIVPSGAAADLSQNTPPAFPTDKTVISKRPLSVELPPPLPTSQSLGAALVGKKFGNYEISEFVGGGGMGAVFRATDISLGRTVAVKVLSRDHTDEETIRRFRNEAQSAARLDHPNIARAYYVGEHEGWNFIVFEFIQGINLRDLVEQRGPLPLEQALHYTLQVAQALEHAAGRDVVHRDIKPSNVLVTSDEQIKLVDMGLARLHQVESSSDDLTASGVTLGTFDYISPEQARDPRMADVRSDIYSLGCTLYFMLAGRPPFPDGTALQKLLWHSGEDPPDPRLFRPDLPPQVIRLLEKMLAKRPAQRPQSPRDLIGEITAVADELGLAGLGARSVAALTAPVGTSFWSRTAGIMVPIAALVLLIMLVDAWRPAEDTAALPRPKLREPIVESKKGEKAPSSPASATGQKIKETPAISTEPSKGSAAQPMEASAASSIPEMNPSEEIPIAPAPTGIAKTTETAAAAGGPPGTPAGAAGEPASSRTEVVLRAADPLAQADLRPEPMESASISASAASPPSGVKPKSITRLIVRPDAMPPAATAGDQEVVRSLARACQRAAELGVEEIELQFSGELLEQPLEVTAKRLSVKSAPGFKPVIVFRPEQLGLASDRQMIRLSCGSAGRIAFQGVELRMELPSEPSSGWALFAIYQMQTLELSDCVLTVKDLGSAGVPVQDQVAFFALQPRRITDTMKMMDDDTRMVPAMGVNLARCIARGEATFLMAIEESPLKVVWTQGLLVTSQRLIETGGSPLKPSEFGRLDIELDHLTAVIPQGLHAMKRRAGNAYQLMVDVRCRKSLLKSNPDAPLFEFADLPTIDDVKLSFGGEGNGRPDAKGLFLRFRPQAKSEPATDFEFSNRDRWSDRQRFFAPIEWQTSPPDLDKLPAHRHTPQHYLLNPDAPYQAGFDRGALAEPSEPANKVVPSSPDEESD